MSKKIVFKKLPDAINQSNFINKLYFNEQFTERKILEVLLRKKINGYKAQDIKNNKYVEESFITTDELIEKLLISEIKCLYCKKQSLLLYTLKRDPRQWTLDRINNNDGHSNKNTVISCLDCNLKRGSLNDRKFLFTKQMKIIKKK